MSITVSQLIALAQEAHGKAWADMEVYAHVGNEFAPVKSVEAGTLHRSDDKGDSDVTVLWIVD